MGVIKFTFIVLNLNNTIAEFILWKICGILFFNTVQVSLVFREVLIKSVPDKLMNYDARVKSG